VHARIHGLPYYNDQQSLELSPAPSGIGSCHKGKVVTVAGTVVRAKGMQLFKAYRLVQCTKCSSAVRLSICVSNPQALAEMPEECPQAGCSSSNFKIVDDDSQGFTNYQEIHITVSSHLISSTKRPKGGRDNDGVTFWCK
jgi:DNA replicative helicase MCM subunit Mcm2 (Cdc46/Mcm family)